MDDSSPNCQAVALLHDRAGMTALEFALVALFMVILLFGTVELGNAFRIQAKVTTAADQLAELVAGQQDVTAPDGSLADMCIDPAMNLLSYARTIECTKTAGSTACPALQ